jgi:hypothetical protein
MEECAIQQLICSLTEETPPPIETPFFHIIESVNIDTREVTLTDQSVWTIRWLSRKKIRTWQPGQRLKAFVSIKFLYERFAPVLFENIDAQNTARSDGVVFSKSVYANRIARITYSPFCFSNNLLFTLDNGMTFKASSSFEDVLNNPWKIHDRIFIWHMQENKDVFIVHNIDKRSAIECCLTTNADSLLNLEKKLNQNILGQPHAAQKISTVILNHLAGLKNPQTPVGVFLFLGPTGVGKTEMAKVLTYELYKTSDALLRFDMSHFSEPHSVARLIGSPPGYVNHVEGGQLTEPLKENSNRIVLLDEIEKCHPEVRRFFLPVFDEGQLFDNKSSKISCHDTLFIMTSNLCSQEILELYQLGYASEDILQILEPALAKALSPEFYNRTQVILFNPIHVEIMPDLVNHILQNVVQRIHTQKNMTLTMSDTVHTYLIEKGYHPTLGVRFLKKLVEDKVVASIASALIYEGIPEGCHIHISYVSSNDSWHVTWWEDRF